MSALIFGFREVWETVKAQGWKARLYWFEDDDEWRVFTLRGPASLEALMDTPVAM